MENVVAAKGDECPAAFVPVRGFRALLLAFDVSGGGVGVTASDGKDEFSLSRGKLFAAAVSNGGGCGRSRPELLCVEAPLERVDPSFGAVSLVVEEGLVVSIDSSAIGTVSRGLNLACSGSLLSTISVVDELLPNKLIFFASATSEERRRSRME